MESMEWACASRSSTDSTSLTFAGQGKEGPIGEVKAGDKVLGAARQASLRYHASGGRKFCMIRSHHGL